MGMFLITHVEAEEQFLKIWARTNENLYHNIKTLLRNLQDKFDYYGPSASSTNLAPGTRCVARAGNNNEFHRVRVINLRSDGMVYVQFLDFGRMIFVPIHNIRTTEEIQQAHELFALHDAATPFYLDGVVPIGGTWSPDMVAHIAHVLENTTCDGFCNSYGTIKTIKFNVMNEDFAQTLVKRNMAIYSSAFVSDLLQSSVASNQTLRQPHQVGRSQSQDQWRVNTSCSQNVPKTRSFKAIQLEIGDLYNITISHIEDGPAKFSVQLLDTLPYLETMMKKINSQPHKPLQEPPIAGTVCLGRQTHPVNRLCRVVLNSPGDTTCKVYFADYGHHETLSFDNIYQIPDEFTYQNIFSIRFTLSGITNWKITNEMKDYFQKLVWDKSLKMKVCKGPMSPLTQYCDLYLQNQCVKDLLLEAFPDACESVFPEAKQLPLGSREEVYVTFVESTSKFFVQIEKNFKLLEDLMAQIEIESKTAPVIKPTQLREAMCCIALYDQDGKWYRASVINKIDQNRVKVFYVDYGNEEIVTINNMRKISSPFVHSVPKQAIKCSLLLPGVSNPELDRIFEDLVIDRRFILQVIDSIPNVTIVELLNDHNVPGNSHNITQLLLNDVTKKQETTMAGRFVDKNADSMYKPSQVSSRNQKCDPKAQSHMGQKQPKSKKNLKTRETWTNQADKSNSYNPINSKLHKDNENENRLRNGPPQNNSFDAKSRGEPNRLNQNDHYEKNRGIPGRDSNRSRGSSILGSDHSDKDSDTSSRNGGRRNTKNERRDYDVTRERQGNGSKQLENENYLSKANEHVSPQKSNKNHQASNFHQAKVSEIQKTKSPKKELSKNYTSSFVSEIPPPNITIGAEKNCVLVHYNNPLSFYLHLCPDNKELFLLMEKIKNIHAKSRDNEWGPPPEPDLVCVAQYSEDDQWYRAVIKSVEISSATVLFIDYGNVETVSFSRIKEIDPELLKLPAQAVHCQLFCCKKWTKEESNLVFNQIDCKDLEAEFVKKENDVYHVLLRQANTEKSTSNFINHIVAKEVDLIVEKNAARNISKSSFSEESMASPEYASLKDKWIETKLNLGSQHNVSISWFDHPNDFYCQLTNDTKQFREMMYEIQNIYVQRSPVSGGLQVGDSVMATFDEDGVIYRAQITKLNKDQRHEVQYVDYGNREIVDPKKIFPVEKKFMTLPKRAIHCSLHNISSVSDSVWSNSPIIQDIRQADSLNCSVQNCTENKYSVTLKLNGIDVGSILIDKNLAAGTPVTVDESEKDFSESQEQQLPEIVSRIDIKLLEGQSLCVKVSNVESVKKFFVQLHTAETSQAAIDSYMSNNQSEMLKLPGQLSVMQNQAIECELFDVSASATGSEVLKKTVGQIVKIFVENVKQDRLLVRLFDVDGNKIKVSDTQNVERISPVCSPLILSNTHEVTITWINNSHSLWLQRTSDAPIENELLNQMFDYYSQCVEKVSPVPNELYAGLSSDLNWYRVKIIKIVDLTATVVFIDYGNIELIDVDNLRPLKSQFYQPYQLGIEVSLSVSLVGSNKEQLDLLESLTMEKKFIAVLYNVRRKWVAELSEGGEKLSDKLASMNVVAETAKIDYFKVPEIEDMVVGNKYDVLISHIIDSREVWLHRVEELPVLEELQTNLQKLASEAEAVSDLKENLLCLAVNPCDKSWRRAKIYSIDEEYTTVQFIDYGNMDAIEHGTGGMKKLPEEWKNIKMFGIPCKLDVVPIKEQHSSELSDKIMELLASRVPLKALVINNKIPMSIDIFAEGESTSVCEKLMQTGLATNAKTTEEFVEEDDSILEEEIHRDPRSTYVCCSGSVDEFWVQDDKWVNELEMIEDRLMMSAVLSPVTDIKEGLVCIAKFPDDEKYYRATILSHSEAGTRVHFMDYGNTALTNDLKIIPEDLAKIRPLARKCRLAKPEGIILWPEDVDEKFIDLSADGATVFLREVLEEGETCLVKLIHEGKDVALELLKMCKKPTIVANKEKSIAEPLQDVLSEERLPPIGQENFQIVEKCGVSYLRTLSDFWINKVVNYTDIEHIANQLDLGDLFEAVTDLKEGKLLAAKYSGDNTWYRSKVVSQNENGTIVLFIDYGNTQIIKEESNLRELPEELAGIPQMAHNCSLKIPENFNESTYVCDKFIDLIDGGNTEFEMKILDKSKKPMLVILQLNGVDVLDILVNCEKELNESKKSEDSGINADNAPINDLQNLKICSTTDVAHVSLEKNVADNTEIIDASNKTESFNSLSDTILVTDSTILTNSRTPSPSENKIVPGSISRGISVEEIERYKPVYQTSSPDDRILPGSCNQGVVPCETEPTEKSNSESTSRCKTPESSVVFSKPRKTECFDDKPVPGSVSRGESPIAERPSTPKTPHVDKLVAGTVNPPKLDLNSTGSWD